MGARPPQGDLSCEIPQSIWTSTWLAYRAPCENVFLWQVAYRVIATQKWHFPTKFVQDESTWGMRCNQGILEDITHCLWAVRLLFYVGDGENGYCGLSLVIRTRSLGLSQLTSSLPSPSRRSGGSWTFFDIFWEPFCAGMKQPLYGQQAGWSPQDHPQIMAAPAGASMWERNEVLWSRRCI